MIRIAISLGSTRPNRNGEPVAKWVYEIAKRRSGAEFELVDIKDFKLLLLDEPVRPSLGTILSVAAFAIQTRFRLHERWVNPSKEGASITSQVAL
jgi:hypothetical protein